MSADWVTSWHRIRTVFAKELRDHTRDKRSVALSMVFPLLAPIMLGLLLSNIGRTIDRATDPGEGRSLPSVAYVSGAEFAPELMTYLKEQRVDIKVAPETDREQRTAVRRGRLPFILIVPEGAAGETRYQLSIILDRNNARSTAASRDLIVKIDDFNKAASIRMMQAQGIDPNELTPITVRENNIGRPQNSALIFYNMIPSLVMFMIFMGAVYLAIDTTVGERERGSLEPLLTAPVERWELLSGKSLAAWSFTAMIVCVNVTAFRIILAAATTGVQNLAPPPSALAFANMFVIAIPLMALAVTVQMNIAAMTRSAKEAQIYLGLLPVVPLVPGLMLAFAPTSATVLSAPVPIYGQILFFADIVRGEPVSGGLVALNAAVTLLAAGVLFHFASRLFEREKMLFGS